VRRRCSLFASLCSSILGFLIPVTACTDRSQESHLNPAVQRAEGPTAGAPSTPQPAKGEAIEAPFAKAVLDFNTGLVRGDYASAVTHFSKKGDFKLFAGIVDNLYRFEFGVSNPKIIGEEFRFFSAQRYDNPIGGKLAQGKASVLTTRGWLTVAFVLRNDAQDDPAAKEERWRLLVLSLPKPLTEEEFNRFHELR